MLFAHTHTCTRLHLHFNRSALMTAGTASACKATATLHLTAHARPIGMCIFTRTGVRVNIYTNTGKVKHRHIDDDSTDSCCVMNLRSTVK